MKTYFFALSGFSKQAQVSFKAVVSLGYRALANEWTYSPAEHADVIVIDLNNATGRILWDKVKQKYSKTILVACGENIENFNTPHKLKKNPTSPPSLGELCQAFNEIAQQLSSDQGNRRDKQQGSASIPVSSSPVIAPLEEEKLKPSITTANYKPTPSTTDRLTVTNATVSTESFNPNNYFIGQLQRIIKNNQLTLCQFQDHPPLLFDPQNNNFYCKLAMDQLDSIYQASANQITLKEVTQNAFDLHIAQLSKASITALFWKASSVGSQGRLLINHKLSDIIHLTRWPDVAHNPKNNQFLTLSAFMNNNATDLNTISKTTGIILTDVIEFYNTCELLGLISHDETPYLHKKTIDDKTRQIYRTISSKLSKIKRKHLD